MTPGAEGEGVHDIVMMCMGVRAGAEG